MNRSLAIPGLGPFIAAGPIMAALAGCGWRGCCRNTDGGAGPRTVSPSTKRNATRER